MAKKDRRRLKSKLTAAPVSPPPSPSPPPPPPTPPLPMTPPFSRTPPPIPTSMEIDEDPESWAAQVEAAERRALVQNQSPVAEMSDSSVTPELCLSPSQLGDDVILETDGTVEDLYALFEGQNDILIQSESGTRQVTVVNSTSAPLSSNTVAEPLSISSQIQTAPMAPIDAPST